MERRHHGHNKQLKAINFAVGICFMTGFLWSVPAIRNTLSPWLLYGLLPLLCLGAIALMVRSLVSSSKGRAEVSTRLDATSTPVKEPPVTNRERLRGIDWFQFEKLVAQLHHDQGWLVQRRGGAHADDGIDLIAEKPGQRVAVQCKHWQNWKVGVKNVREFLGALTAEGIPQGRLVALNGWTADAAELAQRSRIELIGEGDLLHWLDRCDAKYAPQYRELLDDTAKYCPKCESPMVLRTAKRGGNAGGQFWGCATYPRCHQTVQLSAA